MAELKQQLAQASEHLNGEVILRKQAQDSVADRQKKLEHFEEKINEANVKFEKMKHQHENMRQQLLDDQQKITTLTSTKENLKFKLDTASSALAEKKRRVKRGNYRIKTSTRDSID
jgi:chromosome segregation ATPase